MGVILSFAISHHGREYIYLPRRKVEYLVSYLVFGLDGDSFPAFRAVGFSNPCKKKTHVIIYFRYRAYGAASREGMLQGKKDLARLVDGDATARVLVNLVAVTTMPSEIDLYYFVEAVSVDPLFPRTVRVALLADGNTANDARLLETLAVNKAHPVRVFSDRQQAVKWLEA